ncbi:protein lin-52 homolog [Condylostylus longicornis]|uniref:protein lin-52 homolog n=1 Tax=Condylostylus longicornis TaxID=2530218 RepID=UPI00244DC42A|nr:protein lin-52 homolog [Condylostylus longicornis]
MEETKDAIDTTPVKRALLDDDALLALEKLDRASPDLWPEKNFISINNTPVQSSPPAWTRGLSQDDINAMNQLGVLSTNGLISEIRKIYDQAYQLGVMESKEMTRGKYLGIFTNSKKKT